VTIDQSWLIARLQNEAKDRTATIARLDAENKHLKGIIEEMLAELLDVYDGYDRAEAEAYWKGRLS